MSSWRILQPQAVTAPGTLEETVTELASVPRGTDEMEAHRSQIRDFVASHPMALHRTCLAGHLTGSAVILDHDREHVAMLFHTKLQRWLQPGGHADGEGNIASVAYREAQEETGLTDLRVVGPAVDIDVHVIPERGDEPQHFHLDLRYLLLAPEGASLEGNHESQALEWVKPSALPSLGVDAGTLRMVERAFEAAEGLR